MDNALQTAALRQRMRHSSNIQFSFLQNVSERPHPVVEHGDLPRLERFQTIIRTEFACGIDFGGRIVQLLQKSHRLHVLSTVQHAFDRLPILAHHISPVAPDIWLHRHDIIRRHNESVLPRLGQLLNGIDKLLPIPSVLGIRYACFIKQLLIVVNCTRGVCCREPPQFAVIFHVIH
ncbi:hypothetical protein D3C77_466430 [compost metagenome]